jgi:hypothetical protein
VKPCAQGLQTVIVSCRSNLVNQWRSHVEPSGSDDTDDFPVNSYSDQFFTGKDPTKIFVRPLWPNTQQQSLESIYSAQQQQSTQSI